MPLLFSAERPVTPPPPLPAPPPREPDPFGIRTCTERIAAAPTEAHVVVAIEAWGILHFACWEAAAIAAGQQPGDLPPEIEQAAKAALARLSTPTESTP